MTTPAPFEPDQSHSDMPSNRSRSRAATVRVQRLEHAEGLGLPAYQTEGAAGLDLVAAVAPDAPVALGPGERALVPTGLVLELPPYLEAQVRPRSGLALKHGVTVLNAPGTIDADYRGEVQVLLVNLGTEPFLVRRGDRIAQLVVARIERVAIADAADLSASQRGAGGFGSTGLADEAGSDDMAEAEALEDIAAPVHGAKGSHKPAGKRPNAGAREASQGAWRPFRETRREGGRDNGRDMGREGDRESRREGGPKGARPGARPGRRPDSRSDSKSESRPGGWRPREGAQGRSHTRSGTNDRANDKASDRSGSRPGGGAFRDRGREGGPAREGAREGARSGWREGGRSRDRAAGGAHGGAMGRNQDRTRDGGRGPAGKSLKKSNTLRKNDTGRKPFSADRQSRRPAPRDKD